MRERNILQALLALNLALLIAFSSYLIASLHEEAPAPPAGSEQKAPPTPQLPARPVSDPHVMEMASSGRTVDFRHVQTQEYRAYLNALKRAGCPEHHVRRIAVTDVGEFFAQKRLQEAIRHDFEWWCAEPQPVVTALLREKGQELLEQQQRLLKDLLGPTLDTSQVQFWTHVQLSGAVLGALSEKLHEEVQEICRGWMPASTDPAGSAQESANPVIAARSREQMRQALASILSREQLEEFLIRYSWHATSLREELRRMKPTADEFRKAFSAVEPIDREMQLQFGNANALGEAQRQRYLHRRNDAMRQVLASERYAAYMLARTEVKAH
jgi:hypothetical protein